MEDARKKPILSRRLTWMASMTACFAFILMAVKVYELSIPELVRDLLILLLGAFAVIIVSAVVGWLLVTLKGRRK